jgi:ribosomal RNA-processing protein 1
MSDKPLVQQRLAADLANLVLVIQASGRGSGSSEASTEASLHFIAGFWEAMVREWAGIDRLR